MGLNMNRSLLLENSNLQFKIPLYSKCYNAPVFTEGYMLTKISEYNVSVLESMDNIDLITVSGSSNESAVNAVNELAENLDNVINKTRDIKNLLIEMKDQAVESILKEDPNDKLLEGIDSYEMDKVLDECSRNKSTGLRISNITNLNEELLGDFPKIDEAASTLSTIMNESITKVLPNIEFFNKNLNNEEGFSEGLNSLSDNLLDSVLTEVFGKYSYDKSGLMGSVIETSMDAFGYNSRKERLFSTALYNAACRNLNSRQEAADSLNKYMDKVSKSLNEMIVDMSSMRKAIIESEKKIPNDYSKSVNENVVGFIVGLKNKVGDIIGAVKNTVDPTAKLAVNKIGRVNQVYNPDPAYGDSAKLKQLAALLAKQTLANIAAQHQANMNKSLFLKTTDECGAPSTPVNGLQAAQECLDMIDELEGMFAIYNEMCAESDRNATIGLISLTEATEANGNQQQSGGQAQTGGQANTQANAQSIPNPTRNTNIKNENDKINLDKIIGIINDLLNRFKNRIQEITMGQDSAWWKKNRESLKNLKADDFGETTVNEWFEYMLPNFKIEIVEKFDIANNIYASDEALEDHVLSLYNGKHNTAFADDDSFNDKLKKCFYNQYFENDNGTLAKSVVNPTEVFGFLDDVLTRIWNGDYLGSVNKDWKALNTEKENIKSNLDTYVNKYADTHVTEVTPFGTGNAEKAAETGGTPQNGAAIIDDGFERFNLAECFALNNRGGLLNLNEGPNDQQTTDPSANKATDGSVNTQKDADPAKNKSSIAADRNATGYRDDVDQSGRKDTKSRARECIDRYIKINGKAITTKSTMILAAYKQFLSLYKAIRGEGKGKTSADVQDKEAAAEAAKKKEAENLEKIKNRNNQT